MSNLGREISYIFIRTLALLGGDESAGMSIADSGIRLSDDRYSGTAFTAVISPEADGYDEAEIRVSGDVDVVGDITPGGHLLAASYNEPIATLSGASVTWTTEKNRPTRRAHAPIC